MPNLTPATGQFLYAGDDALWVGCIRIDSRYRCFAFVLAPNDVQAHALLVEQGFAEAQKQNLPSAVQVDWFRALQTGLVFT